MRDHVIAMVTFLICYAVGFQVALGEPGNPDVFGYAMLFGVAFSAPSLFFVFSAFLLFWLIGWSVTILLSFAAAGIWYYASHVAYPEGWHMALAVVIATVAHQLTLLMLARVARKSP